MFCRLFRATAGSPLHWYWCVVPLLASIATAQRLHIEARVADGPWTHGNSVNITKGVTFALKVDSVSGGKISWYQIIPDLRPYYQNANFPYEKNPYAWTGFAKIAYLREELVALRGKWRITPAFHCASFNSPYFHDTIGSFWMQAVVETDGGKRTSYGIEDNDARGLSPKVFRVSIRESDDYIGYITSFYNVPGLFGSTPYQCDNYIGADCADVLMAAYAKWKKTVSTKDYNVAMVVKASAARAECVIDSGVPDTIVRWGSQVRQGDLIAVRYEGGKQFQHIGALYQDANVNGVMDADDLVLQAGPFPLCLTPLSVGSFDGEVVVVRLK
jgi:hypothetical protein